MKIRKKNEEKEGHNARKKNSSDGKRDRKRGREKEFNIEKQKPFLHTQK